MEYEGGIKAKWDDTIKNHYVYLHYTLDTDTLFYVGIGTHDLAKGHNRYYRAYQYKVGKRNYLWIRFYNKHGVRVEIYKDNITEKEAKETEIYLISKYGRITNKTGILCNISGGGEGRFLDNSNNKKIYVYSLSGKFLRSFNSCNKASDFYGLERKNVSAAANMKRITCGNFQFRYEYNKGVNIRNLDKSIRKIAIPIIAIAPSGEEMAFSSSYKFQKYLGLKNNSHIMECLHGKRKSILGWTVRYK